MQKEEAEKEEVKKEEPMETDKKEEAVEEKSKEATVEEKPKEEEEVAMDTTEKKEEKAEGRDTCRVINSQGLDFIRPVVFQAFLLMFLLVTVENGLLLIFDSSMCIPVRHICHKSCM